VDSLAAEHELVLYESNDRVATITLNRPEKLNAISHATAAQVEVALARAEADPEVRVIIITGAGRAFSSGADLSGPKPPVGARTLWERYEATENRQGAFFRSKKITISAVNGHCLGRGMELALWCDLVVAAEDAKFGQPEVRHGSFVSTIVPWLMGIQKAKLFMLTGDLMDARQAEACGMAAMVVSGRAEVEATKLAHKLAQLPPVTARSIKQFVNSIYDEHLGLRAMNDSGAAISALIKCITPADMETEHLEEARREGGVKKFLEVRDAPFRS